MRQPSIVIHKGKKEEKYDLYVEDYVISFIKEKKGTQDASEILFYGCREEKNRKYTIYGAGLDRHLTVFDKYELLEEISCKVTQTEPAFLIKETNGVYEVKGYHVFYYDNAEMQDYLIHRGREEHRESPGRGSYIPLGQAAPRHGKANPHHIVSLQMGLVFLVLVAIVINSANSYDKLEQLNQSASEVFFVMENQEAEDPETVKREKEKGSNDIIVKRDEPTSDAAESALLQDSVLRENASQEKVDEQEEMTEKEGEESSTEEDLEAEHQSEAEKSEDMSRQTQKSESEGDIAQMQEEAPEDTADGQTQTEETQQEEDNSPQDKAQETTENEDGVEALSRNVARYYKVERGDTLYMISKKIYGDTTHVKKICEANQITDPDNIRYGQKIILP